MRITTIEKLMSSTDDRELLDIYVELESGKVPSTSYAHEFCRKVNQMIDDGALSVKLEGFRHIYLPSLRKLVYKEMAKRYAFYLQNCKDDVSTAIIDEELADDICKCARCNGEYTGSDLIPTDIGWLCESCITDMRNNDETVTTYM